MGTGTRTEETTKTKTIHEGNNKDDVGCLAHAVVDLEAALLTPAPISKTGIDARAHGPKTLVVLFTCTTHNTQHTTQYNTTHKIKY